MRVKTAICASDFGLHEKLGVDVDGQLVHLVLREHGFLDFLLFLRGRVSGFLGSIVAAARLHRKAVGGNQLDLERMEAAVELQVLRRECQQIIGVGNAGGAAESRCPGHCCC